AGVFSEIAEDVDEGVAHRARRREVAAVPAIGPETAAAHDELVHGAGDADCKTLHAGRERALVACFDDEVQMVPLHGEMEDTKARGGTARCGGERDADGGKDVLATKRAKERAQRDVNRVRRRVFRARSVRDVRARRGAFAAGVDAFAAPRVR